MNENRILFVDLDGTLIKEDLSDLAFVNSLKTNPLRLIIHLIVFFFKGKSISVASKGTSLPTANLFI